MNVKMSLYVVSMRTVITLRDLIIVLAHQGFLDSLALVCFFLFLMIKITLIFFLFSDINECMNVTATCGEYSISCTDTIGGFNCSCPLGYFGVPCTGIAFIFSLLHCLIVVIRHK